MKKNTFSLLIILLCLNKVLLGFAQEGKTKTPCYRKTGYANESITLKNDFIEINFFKRISGWGWGEIYTPSGKLIGVLEHLGELKICDQDIPIRLESNTFLKKQTSEGESLTFNVKSMVICEMLNGTSFENWMHYSFNEPAITGTVTFTLDPYSPLVKLNYDLIATGNYYAHYVRGPWIKVGESSFGIKKDDAILPGVDWVVNDEWTSGTDFFKDPWALRVVPHPNKVTIPIMAISYQGDGIGLSWDPTHIVSRWFNYRSQYIQPIFSAPNFVDRMNNNLMGLMIPDASIEGHENEIYANIPLELKKGQKINFEAELWLSKGNSMNVIIDWIKRHGLPEPSSPKWSYEETLKRIANAYNTNMWHEGKGFGIIQGESSQIGGAPTFLVRYANEHKNTQLGKELLAKMKAIGQNIDNNDIKADSKEEKQKLVKVGEHLLGLQQSDGSFTFDPSGWHYRKDDFKVAATLIEPMGQEGETALDITILPATELLEIGQKTGDQRFFDAAKKGFDFCMFMKRPEGGDFWECPLHAANLLAAGHAAIGNYLAYKQFGDLKYKEKAIYWIRSLLPFTHLWETKNIKMLYNTKPVLSSSDWYFANWVRDHVQWEILSVFSKSSTKGIYWDEIDPEIDWMRYYKGVTNAAIRWINIHTDQNWRPHNIPETYDNYLKGMYDYCFPDTHNSVTGNYGGMFIQPSVIADNIYFINDKETKMKKSSHK